jgi:rare lipoprotein A
MRSFYGLRRLALVSLVSSFAYITINAAHAENGHCGSRTANGERVNCAAMTAAHRTLPFGTAVKVCHDGCVVVRINDRGPFVSGRHIDLTPAAARAIGLDDVGYVTMAPER